MKILVIPDVHGRDFWIEPCKCIDQFDKVIFLGDYHDPYPFQVSDKVSRHRLRDNLVPFVEEHKDKVICLLGNHDGNYLIGEMADRFDRYHHNEVQVLLRHMDLKLAYQEGKYLFTHSGVLPHWLDVNGLTLQDVLGGDVDNRALLMISPYRGGWDRCGSCIWGDIEEFSQSEKIEGLYQIFGHTQMDEARILSRPVPKEFESAFLAQFTDTSDIDRMKKAWKNIDAGYADHIRTNFPEIDLPKL